MFWVFLIAFFREHWYSMDTLGVKIQLYRCRVQSVCSQGAQLDGIQDLLFNKFDVNISVLGV
jgi:hypothetical protein